ncbi:DUF4390 domain-containing protein [Brachyspira aalborgi]|uniref:DUF4390 domain-containing protein n=1 Tax=Brachyspira aalborgi TaxID=29522 RepID=A0A5C8GJ08_9SPIR|nr:DUF4390 domain-containing protein [Brachyspira aalborgi]TXJ61962.1 DUF4390 domain-containing protein [Brachyspira aalborgi]
MLKYKNFIKLIIILLILSIPLYSHELRLHYSRSYIDNNILYADVYAGINIEIDENIKRYVESGIIVFLNFRIDFLRKRAIFNENLKEVYLSRRIYYDFFTKEYVAVNSETSLETRSQNFYVLIRTLYQISRVEIYETDKLSEENIYFFKTRLSIRFQNAFPYLSVFFNAITPLQYRIKWLKSEEFKINELY